MNTTVVLLSAVLLAGITWPGLADADGPYTPMRPKYSPAPSTTWTTPKPYTPMTTKPPYTATPHGEQLSPHVPATPSYRATPTPGNPNGGYPGLTRKTYDSSTGIVTPKLHGGLDVPGNGQSVSRYYGPGPGYVTRSGPAWSKEGYLGQRVEIETPTKDGVWTSKTMHHSRTLVKEGQMVLPGQPYAIGSGVGDQFGSRRSGGPHTHYETSFNGRPVNPLTGAPLSSGAAR